MLMILVKGISKEIFIFGSKWVQRMCKSVLDEKTWPYIILNHDCLIFKEINNETKFYDFQH